MKSSGHQKKIKYMTNLWKLWSMKLMVKKAGTKSSYLLKII